MTAKPSESQGQPSPEGQGHPIPDALAPSSGQLDHPSRAH